MILLSLVAIFVAASGAQHLGFSTNYRVFFSKDNPQLNTFEEFQKVYTKTDNVLFVVKAPEGDAFQEDVLEAVQELTDGSWRLPYASRVDSVSNFQYTYAEDDDLIVEDLVEEAPSSYSAEERVAKKKVSMDEPILKERLVSKDGNTTGVNVTMNFRGEDPLEVNKTAAKARELRDKVLENHPDLKIAVSGLVAMNNGFMEASQNDMATLVPLMYTILLVALVLFLRSFWGTVATLFMIALSAAAGMGFAGWMGYPLTPPSASAPTIILTLAIADSVHVLNAVFKFMQAGMKKHEALVESIRVNMQPIFLTSVTTAIGFMSLNFSDSPPFRHLGNMTAFGVMAAFFLSVTFLPAIASLLPMKVKQRPENHSGVMDKFAEWVIRSRKFLLVSVSLLVIGLAVMIPRIELNDEFVQYFDESFEFRRDTDFMMNNLTGLYNAEFSLGAGEAGAIAEPEYLKKVDEFAKWLETQPEVQHVYSMVDVFKRLNKNLHGDDPAYDRIPETRRLAAQYLLLYEMSLPRGLDINDRINVDKSATRMTVTLNDISTVEMRDFKDRSEQWLKDNAPAHMHTLATSSNLMFAYISERNIKSMTKGNALALFLISILIMFALRSVKMGLFSMIPNLVPAIMAFGIWAIFVGQVNMAVSVVMAVSLGIIVDDTVHFLSKYYRARREKGMGSRDSVRYAFHMVGSALVITSFVLIAGFAVLATSAFQMNSVMGSLNALAIGCALFADFLLLPPLLMLLDRKDPKPIKSAATAPE